MLSSSAHERASLIVDETNDAANLLLNFLDSAGATVKATLDKPRCCRRKVNHRRFLQKQFLRLSGGMHTSSRSSHGKEEPRGERKRTNAVSKHQQVVASATKTRPSSLKTAHTSRQDEVVVAGVDVPSPSGSEQSSSSSQVIPLSCGKQHVGDNRKWMEPSSGWTDDHNQVRSPTSFSDGSVDYVLSPSPTLCSASDCLSVSSDNSDSLPCSPCGVTEVANLLTSRHWSGTTTYPPRLHHLEDGDLVSFVRSHSSSNSTSRFHANATSTCFFGRFGHDPYYPEPQGTDGNYIQYNRSFPAYARKPSFQPVRSSSSMGATTPPTPNSCAASPVEVGTRWSTIHRTCPPFY